MNQTKGHPKGLYLLFVTEMWERFSYYGMRALFMLYMVQALLFDKEMASQVYGSYTGLVYLTPLIGGYIADRYWGTDHGTRSVPAVPQCLLFSGSGIGQIPDVLRTGTADFRKRFFQTQYLDHGRTALYTR